MSKPAQIASLAIVLAVPVIAVGSVTLDPDPLFLIGWIVLAALAVVALVLVAIVDATARAGRDIFGPDDAGSQRVRRLVQRPARLRSP